MRPGLACRWSLSVTIVFVALVGAAFNQGASHPQPPYGPAIVGDAQLSVRFLAPLAAAVAAYLLHPVSSYLDDHPSVRGRGVAVAVMVWPVLAAVTVAYLSVCVLTALRAGSLAGLMDLRALSMMGVDLLVLTSWTAIGAVAASVLPHLLAPVVGVIAYLWLAWLPALGTPWLRHVTGQQSGCCGPDSEPIPAIMALGALVAVGLGLASTAAVSARTRARRAALSSLLALVVAAGLVVAASMPTRSAFVVAQPRGDDVVCASGESTVCTWPEYGHLAPGLSAVVGTASSALTRSGLGWELPAVLSEQPGPGQSKLGFNGQGDDQVIANAAYEALVSAAPATASCWPEGQADFDPVDVGRLLIAAHAGADLNEVRADPAVLQEVHKLLRDPVSEQRAFIDGVVDGCENSS